MQNFHFTNQDVFIRCYDPDAYTSDHWFLKKDVVSIYAISDKLLKIVIRNKPPLYFLKESIGEPYAGSVAELASELNHWITDIACCGNYPSEEPASG